MRSGLAHGRHVAVGLVITVVAALAGCAGVPPAELHIYTDSLAQAQDAGNAIYRAMIPALVAGGAKQASGYPVSLGPETYDRSGCDPDLAAFPSLQARCAALAAVRSFNQAMLDLQAGASVAAVQAQLGGLESGAETLVKLVDVPGVNAVFATAQTLFPALETVARELAVAADRAALKARLDEARPVIDQLLRALQDDVPGIYGSIRAYYDGRLTDFDLAIAKTLSPALKLADTRLPPSDAAALTARQAVDARFEVMFAPAEPAPSAWLRDLRATGMDVPVFSTGDAEKINATLNAVEPQVAQFRATAREWQSFRQALSAYDFTLTQVRAAFAKLVAASQNPLSTGGGTSQLLESALAIREQAALVQQKLAAPR